MKSFRKRKESEDMTEAEKLDAGLEYDFWDEEVDGRKLHAMVSEAECNPDAE